MSKFSFKKLAVSIVSAAGISALSFGVAGCMPKSADLTEPDNIEITRLAPPTDGSLPTAHSCAENMAYVVSVFDSQPQYHSYSYGVTTASIATQTTRTFRDYKDGVLLTTDLTYSSMVKSGSQTCTVVNEDGESEVYFRVSEAPEADTLPSQAVWSEEAPTFFNERAYHYTYGLLPTELFNYIVNEQNIIDSEQVKVNSDGTYTQNFTLDPKASTYFYQFGMKTRGGLSGYPEFESITFSVTFDGQWRILSSNMHEVAKVNKGIVVASISDFSTEYYYGDDRFDSAHYAYYDSYYKAYLDSSEDLEQGGATDDKPVIDVTNVLSNGFSQIMDGGAQFEISADLGANSYKGYAFVSLDLADPLETLALKLSLGKSFKEQNLFVEYGNGGLSARYGKDFALSANLAEVKLAVGELGEVIDKIAEAFASGAADGEVSEAQSDGAEESDPLAALMDAMVLTAGEKQAVLSLNTDDLLGLGIGINVELIFGINNNKITFRGGTVNDISIGGEKLDVALTILTTTAPEIGADTVEGGADLAEYIADVHSLLGADLIKVNAKLNGNGEKVKISGLKGLEADVTAYADLDGVSVGADASVSYTYQGHTLSAAASVWYGYSAADNNYGTAVLQLTEFNGSPVDLKLKCDVKELAEAISTLLVYSGAEAGSGTDGLVSLLNGVLSSDLASLLTELKADKSQIKIGVSVDALLDMIGVNAGVEFGSCALAYRRGESVYGGELSAELPAIGFALGVSGAEGRITAPDLDGCLDLIYVIDDVKSLMNAGLLKARIELDGSAEGVTLSALGGVKAGLTVYFDAQDIAVSADAEVSYTYGEDVVSAKISAWYDKDEGLGEMLLSLNEINGVPVSARVYCNVSELKDAVVSLFEYADITLSPFGGGQESGGLADILTDILAADFAKLIPVLSSDGDGIKIALDTDELLSVLKVNAGFSLGKVNLAYSHAGDEKLVAAVPALGIDIGICGTDGEIERPSVSGAFDLTGLVKLVESAWREVDGIISEKRVAFEIEKGNTYLSLDGIVVDLWGKGEIGWKSGEEYVALDLGFMISENGLSDEASFKFIYDKNANDKPFIRLALNEVGIDIYKDDIESVKNGFNEIYEKVSVLFGGSGEQVALTAETDGAAVNTEAEAGGSGKDRLIGILFGILSDGGWVDTLNDLTLTVEGNSLALSYLADNAAGVEITVDGGLALNYDGAFGSRFGLRGGVCVSSVCGGLVGSVANDMEYIGMSSSKTEGSAGFVRNVYDFLFEGISSLPVNNILGTNTYTVKFALNGANTNIPELEDVFVNAELYVTGAHDNQPKLAEADLNIDAKGVIVRLNVITERRNNNTHFYINLNQVADIKLPDLKFMATQNSLYDTIDVLLSTVNETDILSVVAKLMKSGAEEAGGETAEETDAPNGAEDKPISDDTLNTLCDVIEKLLNFDFNQAVVATEVNGITTAKIDLDNIVNTQLGYKTGALGMVVAEINHNNHSMKTSGTTVKTDEDGVEELKEWISLSSELAERRSYEKFERKDYISIEFLPTLIDDLVKMLVDDQGNMHDKFTLSGTINANLVNMLDVVIDNVTVTAGIDKENGLTASLVMHVNKAKVIGIGIPESTVGLTYQNGYITLAKGLDGSSPKYKVMTMDYFVDHMVTKNDSVLQWWLDISGWSLIMSFVKADVSSGLTNTKDVYLYKATEEKVEQEISMYDFVDALRVVVNGEKTADFGDISDLERTLGVSDNYYGFALNGNKVTGGVLNKLYAALLRDENGIAAIKASGDIVSGSSSLVSFSATLNYKEDRTEEFVVGNKLAGEVTAPSMYGYALAAADAAGVVIDFDHFAKTGDGDEKFGCFSTDGMVTDYSVERYTYELTVKNENGETTDKINVRSGSTVYMYDNDSPLYTDSSKAYRILYSPDPATVGDKQFVMTEEATVYAVIRKTVKIIVHNDSEEVTVVSFAGDRVPTSVKGLETLEAPKYADGTPVGENDIIDGNSDEIHIYGLFANSTVTVNNVVYSFNAQTREYTVSGRAAGFNDKYCTQGETLVLESQIGNYPVTAIGALAFANTEGKPLVSVVVPASITRVGEQAFLDNYGMKQVVFLAETVTFEGKDGKTKTMPFYGCSTLDSEEKVNGNNGNEVTGLHVYYNTILTEGGNWRHFRYVNKVVTYNFYIGKNGGGDHGSGTWSMVDVEVVGAELAENDGIDLNALVSANVNSGLKTDGAYTSQNAAQLQAVLVNAFAQFKNAAGGDKYVVTVSANVAASGEVKVSVKLALNVPKKITVRSRVAMDYVVGSLVQPVRAGVATEVYATEEDGAVQLSTPAVNGYLFLGWETSTENGVTVYVADWAQEFTLTIRLNRPAYKTDSVHVNANAYAVSGHANPFSKQAATVTTVSIYEGQATFTLSENVLTIKSFDATYTIFVLDCEAGGKEKTTKRNISSSLNGNVTIGGDTTLTLTY